MSDISTLNVRLTATAGGFGTSLRGAGADLSAFASTVDSVGDRIGGFATKIASVGAGILGGVGLGMGIKLAADAEQTQVAMATMLKSGEAAKGLLADLSSFAASTPFEFPELADASKKLLAFGSTASDIIPELTSIGDIAAGIGAPIGELAELYGKARTQGTLFAEDINQLTGRGIPIIAEFAKQLGVSQSQVKGLASSGQIGFDNLRTAFKSMTSDGGQFFGMMEAQSHTLGGLASTLKDTVGMAMKSVGETLIRELDVKDGMVGLIKWIEDFGKTTVFVFGAGVRWVKDHAQGLKDLVKITALAGAAFAGYRTAMLAVTAAQKAWAAGQAVVLALSGPKAWLQLAAGLAIAGAAYATIDSVFKDVAASASKAAAASDQLSTSIQTATKPAAGGPTAAAITGEIQELIQARAAIKREQLSLVDQIAAGGDKDSLHAQLESGNRELARLAKEIETKKAAAAAAAAVHQSGHFTGPGSFLVDPSLPAFAEGVAAAHAKQSAAMLAASTAAATLRDSVAKTVVGLQEEARTVGLSTEQITLRKLAQQGATAADLASAAAAMNVAAAMKGAIDDAKTIRDELKSLEDANRALRFSTDELTMARLNQHGAMQSERDYAQSLQLQNTLLQRQKDHHDALAQSAKQMAEDVLTPLERYQKKLEEIAEAEKEGLLDSRQAMLAKGKAMEGIHKSDKERDLQAIERRFTAGFTGDSSSRLEKLGEQQLKKQAAMEKWLRDIAAKEEKVVSLGG